MTTHRLTRTLFGAAVLAVALVVIAQLRAIARALDDGHPGAHRPPKRPPGR